MRKGIVSIAALSILFSLVACHSIKYISKKISGGSELLYKYQWNLMELQGQTLNILSGNLPNLLFTPNKINKVSGSTGCNKLNGSFQLTGENVIKISPLATTKMACMTDNVEPQFLDALSRVNNWRIINDQLLLSDGKIVLLKLKTVTPELAKLQGTWELNYISGPRIAFSGLYPDKKPIINFNLSTNELGGNTSCNGFSSKTIMNGNKISIAEPFAKTMIFCEGGGETTFLTMLKKVNKYAITNENTLTFMIDDVAVMRFAKIK